MMKRQRLIEIFYRYVEKYDLSNPKIACKFLHTLKVSENCDMLADFCELSQSDKDLIWFIGLVHDIGRFEQIKRYDTFMDRDSIDHAYLGTHVLFDEKNIRKYIEDDCNDQIIKIAVLNHNKLNLPFGLTKRERLFCDLIRDADKIDIFRIFSSNEFYEIYEDSNIVDEQTISEEVYKTMQMHRTVPHQFKKNAIDNLVSTMSLVYDFAFDESKKIVINQGYFDIIARFESKNKKTNDDYKLLANEVRKNLYENKQE